MANPRLPPKQAIRVKKQISRVKNMTKQDLKSMSVDELWSLHERVTLALARKITDEKSQLDHRLRQLGLSASGNAKNLSASGSAKKLDDFRIQPASGRARRSARL